MPDFETKVASLLAKVAALLTARNWRMATGGRKRDTQI